MEQLAASIRSMGPPLKVAQTRLALRTSRPEIEACRDPPHHRYGTAGSIGPLSHVSCLTTVCWQACERGWRDPGQRGAPQRQAEGGADRAPGDPQHGSSDARRLTIEI